MKRASFWGIFFFILLSISCKGSDSLLTGDNNSSQKMERNLSTPISRLVGHWISEKSGQHYYFCPINESNQEGRLIILYPNKEQMLSYMKEKATKTSALTGQNIPQKYFDELTNISAKLANKAYSCEYRIVTNEPNGTSITFEIRYHPEIQDAYSPGVNLKETMYGYNQWTKGAFAIEKTGLKMKSDPLALLGDAASYLDSQTKALMLEDIDIYKFIDLKTNPEGK